MPQMAPTLWLNMMIVSMLMMLVVMSIIYFSKNNETLNNVSSNKLNIKNKTMMW